MKKYRLINNVSGWAVFTVAAFTYLMTIEPTASLWDCGEFVASCFKLEVGHPPGNPVFMIMGRFFTLFAGGNVTKVAAMVNSMSALASAFTILFLFWTITHLARKILLKSEENYTTGRIVAVMAAGIVGAVAYSFTDSFWFSAVEGEVYASSAFFTALVFWAILKWEDVAGEKYADRWIILIGFLMGLSIGVHLLNLLTLPGMVLVYYFKKFEFSWKGFLISLVTSLVFLSLLMYGIMPGIVTISSKFDWFFVNTLHLPDNSGMVVHIILVAVLYIFAVKFSFSSENRVKNAVLAIAALFFTGIWVISGSSVLNIIALVLISGTIWYIAGKSRTTLNTLLTVIMVILIGYSANAIIVIRSSANTPLNENNPSNPFNLLYFLNREQYGERPLFKGPYYNAPVTDYVDGKPKYALENGKYIITGHNLERVYDPRFITLFPRMWSDQSDHEEVYKQWGRVKGTPIQVTDQNGEKKVLKKPTFSENLRFMFSYQFGYMYYRYFMWNFAGKQNDTQGTGGAVNGNWISGINFIDEPRVGTSDLPGDMKTDPSRNKYYLLPFILGLVGMFYQLNRDNKNWGIVLLLFVMTGIAIVVYLNQSPNQPRERDYAYAGSFYFYAIWIGMGVLALFEGLSKLISEKIAAPVAGLLCFVAVPVVLGAQNWDDHDRSGRYLARDVAFDYLNSCAPDAILFTNGDNDTFPLWYAQEVEGMRTDMRVCNLMLLNTDWYIDQMKCRTYGSAPLPVTLPVKKYYDGINNQLFIVEKTKDPVDISTIIDFVKSDNKATKVQVSSTEILDIIPSRTIRIPVDKAKVLASGTVKPEDADKIVPYIDIKLKGNSILKSQLIVLDILAHNNWERPIYFVTGYHNDALGLEEYFQLEGLAYRLVPIKSQNKNWLDYGRINTDILYQNMINKFVWGGANKKGVDIDYNHIRTLIVVKARLNYARLAKALSSEGKNEKAIETLNKCMEALPLEKIPYDPYTADIIEAYFAAGATEKAVEMSTAFCDYYYKRLDYFLKQKPYIVNSAEFEIQTAIQYTSRVANACVSGGKPEMGEAITKKLETYYSDYVKIVQPGGK
jgi:4-amino-4-deoxy-L-arabinose transferase and related glycosyltransferases of PMT family